MRLLIGIPAYNEARMIDKVIKSIPKKIKNINKIDILVVDDGSTDRTAQVARAAGANVLTHLINRGLGGALKTIFVYAKQEKYDLLVTIDADGQHDSKDLSRVIHPIVYKRADVVIGTRWNNTKNVPISRLIVNKFANFMTFLLVGINTTDSQSGFRAFDKKAIELTQIQTDGMEVSSEFFKEIQRNKLYFKEVPIRAIYTEYSRSKGQQLSNAPNVLLDLFVRFFR